MTQYLLALGCIFAINLMPAFGPPTWALLVFFRFNSDLAAVPLIIGGAIAAASGRLLLARVSCHFRDRFSERRRANLAAAREVLAGDRRRTFAGLALFALSPVPSAQLFVAAGLLALPLLPLTAAFFAGRIVSYSIYVGGAALAKDSIGDAFLGVVKSPLGVALQVVMLAGLVALLRVDWAKLVTGHRPS